MGHTYSNILLHVVFSTKNRQPYMDETLRNALFPYMRGIARDTFGDALLIGGVADHLHGLIVLKPPVSVSDAMRTWKANSSGWIHNEFPALSHFAWQSGYAAFSVSESNKDAVLHYIANQEEHHRKMTFQDEFLAMLKKHGVEYDPKYVFD